MKCEWKSLTLGNITWSKEKINHTTSVPIISDALPDSEGVLAKPERLVTAANMSDTKSLYWSSGFQMVPQQ